MAIAIQVGYIQVALPEILPLVHCDFPKPSLCEIGNAEEYMLLCLGLRTILWRN